MTSQGVTGTRLRDLWADLYELDASQFCVELQKTIAAWGSTGKGAALEGLARRAVSSVKLFTFRDRDLQTVDIGELDLTYQVTPFAGFDDWGTLLFVECKNWNRRIDVKEALAFGMKVTLAGAKSGLLIARKGVTGDQDRDAERAIQRMYDVLKIRILVIDMGDLRSIAKGEKKVYEVLREKDYLLRVRPRSRGP